MQTSIPQPAHGEKEVTTLLNSAIKRYVDADHIKKNYIPPIDKELTETRHAERFIRDHGKNVGFISNQKKWIVWNGKFWGVDEQGEIFKLLEKVTDKIWKRISTMADDAFGIKRKWIRYATRLHSFVGINNLLKLVSNELVMAFSDFDQDPYLFNCENGVIDLKKGAIQPHNHDLYISQYSTSEYSPDTNCDSWLRFLDKVTGHNDELIAYIQRAIGYSMTGSTAEQCLFVLHGQGQNGKPTFLNVIQALFGDYGQTTHMRAFTYKGESESVRNDIARLHNARLVTATELGRGKKLDMPLIKEITGGDEVTARFLYAEYFSYTPKSWELLK